MQRTDRPAQSIFVRYPQTRTFSVSLPQTGRLELLALYILVCAFWGIILFEALNLAR
jgi:hypothetical protein